MLIKRYIVFFLCLWYVGLFAQLSSLIQLNPDSTQVLLQDYFEEDIKVISHCPDGLVCHLQGKELLLTGDMKQPMDYLSFDLSNGKKYAIPVRKSKRVPYVFTFVPEREYHNLKIKGNFNGWDLNANPMILKEGKYEFTTYLNPGKYEYVLVDNGKEFPDPSHQNRVSNGIGGINSTFVVAGSEGEQPFISFDSYSEKGNQVWIQHNTSDIQLLALYNNTIIEKISTDKKSKKMGFSIPKQAQQENRSFLRVYGYADNKVSNEILIPMEKGVPIMDASKLNRKDKNTMMMYSVFIDRFYNGDTSNDYTVDDPLILPGNNWKGGDLQGVLDKIKQGYFTDLGINTLWLLPVVKNPKGTYGHLKEYGVETKFTGYHGYWPISSSEIDERFGTEDLLQDIIEEVHQQDTNILLDYVANHVHIEHPLIKEHPDWITNVELPDGRKNIRLYDEYRLTTWFDEFLPTLDLENPEVVDVMTDSAVYWFKKYDIDGFRHDATKHIPNNFWRTLTHKLKKEVIEPQNRSIYQIGETYGGDELISSYINNGMLDAQFDFNAYHHITHAIMEDSYSMENLKMSLENSLYYYGNYHLMGNITGNHDKGRIMSYADGSLSFNESAKEAGYTRDIEVQDVKGYQKVGQLMAYNFFVPGIPIIYYGDEIGMPGGDDPDNRRMMQFEGLDEHQVQLKNTVTKLAQLRRNRMELMYGATQIIEANESYIIIRRVYGDSESILILNKSNREQSLNFVLGGDVNPVFLSAFDTSRFMTNNGKTITLLIEPQQFDILISKPKK